MAISNKTVVIVGAGASADLKLPLGGELKDSLAKLFSGKRSEKLSLILDCMKNLESFRPEEISRALKSMREKCGFIRNSRSIDNFLDQERKDKALTTLGKIAIAFEIAEAERKCDLNNDAVSGCIEGETMYFLGSLLNQVVRGHSIDEIQGSLNNLSFITFNYDRCIERYFDIWLKMRYRDQFSPAPPIVHHVYGSIGPYPEVNPFDHIGRYCLLNPQLELAPYIPGLRVFTEAQDDQVAVSTQKLIREAKNIIILGFGYELQNMQFFERGYRERKKVFATHYKMPTPSAESVKSDLFNRFCQTYPGTLHFADLPAKDFLNDYDHPLGIALGAV